VGFCWLFVGPYSRVGFFVEEGNRHQKSDRRDHNQEVFCLLVWLEDRPLEERYHQEEVCLRGEGHL